MQDWERVIEERRRMQQLTQRGFDKNLDQQKIVKRRNEEEKQAAALKGDANFGEPGDGGFDGIEFWTIEADFVVS